LESGVGGEGHREQEVAQPIGPPEELRADRFSPVESPEFPLGPAGDRAGDVELGGHGRPAGEDERVQRGVTAIEPVDRRLETDHVAGFDPMGGRGGGRRDGELGLGDEELVLELADDRSEVVERRRQRGLEEPQVGAELVEGAVGADARGLFRYARTKCETGRPVVTGTGVETRDVLASGRQGNWSNGELRPWTGQNEMCSTSLCLAS